LGELSRRFLAILHDGPTSSYRQFRNRQSKLLSRGISPALVVFMAAPRRLASLMPTRFAAREVGATMRIESRVASGSGGRWSGPAAIVVAVAARDKLRFCL
jgi:hypothetical protein